MIYLLLIFSASFVHAEGLSIIGIPLSGTIEQFSDNAKKYGYKVSPLSKELPIGQRLFEVRFAGEDAFLLVSYKSTSKQVYDAVLTVSSFEESGLDKYYKAFKTIISGKFLQLGKSSKSEIDQFHGKNMWRYFCYDENSCKIASAYILLGCTSR